MQYKGFGIVSCHVLCENSDLSELGVDSEMWLPYSFDLAQVKSMKLAVDPDRADSIQHGMAQLFFKGSDDYVVVDVSYEQMIETWLLFRQQNLAPVNSRIDD